MKTKKPSRFLSSCTNRPLQAIAITKEREYMRFQTLRESEITANALNDELQPMFLWAGEWKPARFTGGKHHRGRKDPYELFPYLACAACSVPAGLSVSVLTAFTQTGLDGINWLRRFYHHVETRPRSISSDDVETATPRKKRGVPSKNGKGRVNH